jgi:hypothetical protein
MATTTNYGWDTPDDTDLVKDGAAAIRTLGSSIDTTTKNLNPQTTTGAIAYRSATANVNTALPLGTANQVLRVNSGGTAPEWATAASASPASASARVNTNQNTSSTTYTDLATPGPAVTLTTGTKALVIVTALQFPATNQLGYMSFAVSGATTIAASDLYANIVRDDSANNDARASAVTRLDTLTAGSNTFTAKYRCSATLGAYIDREICVIDLGS